MNVQMNALPLFQLDHDDSIFSSMTTVYMVIIIIFLPLFLSIALFRLCQQLSGRCANAHLSTISSFCLQRLINCWKLSFLTTDYLIDVPMSSFVSIVSRWNYYFVSINSFSGH